MWICRAGGAPPAGPGNATRVFIAIRFQCVTSFACATAGTASATAAANTACQACRIGFSPRCGVTRTSASDTYGEYPAALTLRQLPLGIWLAIRLILAAWA